MGPEENILLNDFRIITPFCFEKIYKKKGYKNKTAYSTKINYHIDGKSDLISFIGNFDKLQDVLDKLADQPIYY